MNLDSVIKVNGVICERISDNFIVMYGRKKRLVKRNKRVVENHVLSGKFYSVKVS